jgi:hypothetical protein
LAKGEEGGGFAGIARSIAPYSEGDVDELVSSVYFCFLATISASETRWSTEAKHEWASQQAYIYIYILKKIQLAYHKCADEKSHYLTVTTCGS